MDSTSVDEFLATLPAAYDKRVAYVPGKEIAARIRTELKLAVKAGVFPANTEFSVSLNRGGFTTSINVEITRWEGAVFCDDYVEVCLDAFHADREPSWDRPTIEIYSERFAAARRDAERISNRHNYDNSQIEVDHFDVGYYLHVESGKVEAAAHVGIRCEADPKFATKRAAAQHAAKTLPANLVRYYARDGVDNAGAYTLDKIIEWGELARHGAIVHDKRRGWIVQSAGAAA